MRIADGHRCLLRCESQDDSGGTDNSATIPVVGAAQSEGEILIRQVISCDICGTEKRQTNHWFVAYEQCGELRVSGWNSRRRLWAESKHLCGQNCMHKLVDEFMANAIAAPAKRSPNENGAASKTNPRLASDPADITLEPSARMINSPVTSCSEARDSRPGAWEHEPKRVLHASENQPRQTAHQQSNA
jgi:hypothetical protein